MSARRLFLGHGKKLRAGWRIAAYALLVVLFTQVALLLYYRPFPAGLSRGEVGNLIHLDALLCAAALASAWIAVRFLDRRPFREFGFGLHARAAVDVGQGLFAGFAMITGIGAFEAACGFVRFGPPRAPLPELLRAGTAYLAAFSLSAALEEMLARGYAFQALVSGVGRAPAVAITSGLFGLGHIINPHAGAIGVVNTVIAGVWLALAYLKTRSLWLPTALHLSWNFSMAYLFGFPVSGLRIAEPLIPSVQSGPDWVTGGSYGPEGGIVCTAALLLSAAWLRASPHVRPSPSAGALWLPEPAAPGEGTPSGRDA